MNKAAISGAEPKKQKETKATTATSKPISKAANGNRYVLAATASILVSFRMGIRVKKLIMSSIVLVSDFWYIVSFTLVNAYVSAALPQQRSMLI
ncbi:hypothetical protein C5S35_08405 [Candidatus Methanophagaceae archaeon]|nr:hypothetical protein C5S35_08405 [Methanophagales archaeon]